MSTALVAGAPVRHLPVSYWGGWQILAKWIGLVAIGLIYFPLIWLALLSVSLHPLSGVPYPLSLANYRALIGDLRWTQPLLMSVLIGLGVAMVTAASATALGRVIPRMRRPGRIVFVAVIPLFVPGMATGAAMFIFFRALLGLKLGYWSIFLGHLVWAFPFALLLLLVLTTRFDYRLVEAATDLGASKWRAFWDIEFPILRPAIVGAGLFGFLLSFNEIQRSVFLRGTTTTMPVWNWIMASSQQSQVPIIFCLATITLLVVLPTLSVLFWALFVRLDAAPDSPGRRVAGG
jgi:ABC-type spermidine/putrescine transport system permease subunit II